MKYLSEYINGAQTNAFNNAGAFFAFSNDQFNEAKKEGVIYVNMGAGLVCPKDNTAQLREALSAAYQAGIAQDLAENGKAAIIERELGNYECFYTNDISDAVEALKPYGISELEVKEVFTNVRNREAP